MSGRVEVDVDTMTSIAGRLGTCAQSLMDVAGGVPDAPDAGTATETVAALLSWTLKGAVTVASTASATGDDVTTAMSSYTGTDTTNAAELSTTTQVLR